MVLSIIVQNFSNNYSRYTVKKWYVPLLFCLLPDKKRKTYVFSYKKTLRNNELSFNPELIVLDFETVIYKAERKVLKTTEIVECNFHLRQSWFRKIQNLGLSKEYKSVKTDVRKILNYLFSLCYLPDTEVGDCLILDFLVNRSNDGKVEAFCN